MLGIIWIVQISFLQLVFFETFCAFLPFVFFGYFEPWYFRKIWPAIGQKFNLLRCLKHCIHRVRAVYTRTFLKKLKNTFLENSDGIKLLRIWNYTSRIIWPLHLNKIIPFAAVRFNDCWPHCCTLRGYPNSCCRQECNYIHFNVYCFFALFTYSQSHLPGRPTLHKLSSSSFIFEPLAHSWWWQ